jgi:hypothetical protein
MTTRLDPPPIPPLSPAQHDRLRRQLMARTRPAHGTTARRWVPAVAVVAVAAVAVGVSRLDDVRGSVPPVAGSSATPSPTAASSTAPSAAATPQGDAEIPAKIDLGPASAELLARCNRPGRPLGGVDIWSRQFKGPEGPALLAVLKTDSKPYSKLGIRYCEAMASGSGGGQIDDDVWSKLPTRKQGLTKVLEGAWLKPQPTPPGYPDEGRWALFHARPEIATVKSRLVWKGGAGPWTEGVVHQKMAYTDSRANFPGKTPAGLREEIRAYDANGRPVPVDIR